jgi:hypothetical protein
MIKIIRSYLIWNCKTSSLNTASRYDRWGHFQETNTGNIEKVVFSLGCAAPRNSAVNMHPQQWETVFSMVVHAKEKNKWCYDSVMSSRQKIATES